MNDQMLNYTKDKTFMLKILILILASIVTSTLRFPEIGTLVHLSYLTLVFKMLTSTEAQLFGSKIYLIHIAIYPE